MSQATTQGGVQMQAETTQGVQMKLTHGPSGVTLLTDAPKDNGGDASSFSPTDLLGASLVSCAVTTMSLAARRENIPWGAVKASVEKRMTATPPRRIAELRVRIQMASELPEAQRAHLEEIGRGCPVSRSLHPDVKVSFEFVYDGSSTA